MTLAAASNPDERVRHGIAWPRAGAKPRNWLCLIAAALTVGVWHGSTISLGLGYYDEGLAVVGAERVLAGEVPYRDFWSLYAPGNFYFIAGVFGIFGKQLLASRIASLVAFLLSLGFLESISRRMLGPVSAVAVAAGAGICAKMPWGAPTTLAMLPVLASAHALFVWIETKRKRWAFWCGACAGLASIVRHDFGFYAIVAIVACICLTAWRDVGFRPALFRCLVAFAGGLSLVTIPAVAALFAVAPWHDIVADLLVFPATIYPGVRKLPWPGVFDFFLSARWTFHGSSERLADAAYRLPFAIAICGPLVGLAACGMALLRKGASSSNGNMANWSIGICSLWALVFLSQARIRPDHGHMAPSLMFTLPALCGVIAKLRSAPMRVLTSTLLWIAVLGSQAREKHHDLTDLYYSPLRIECGLPRAKGIVVDRERDVAVKALQFVRATTRADEFIYVGHTRHDRILAGATLCYFLAERRCPNRYQEMHPGLTTTEPVQSEIVESLKAKNVRMLLLYDESAAPQEPNQSAESSGVFLLDDYIKSRYRLIREFGCYKVWVQNAEQ